VLLFEVLDGFAEGVGDGRTRLGEATVAGEDSMASSADVARVGVDNLLDDGNTTVADFFGVSGDMDVVVETYL